MIPIPLYECYLIKLEQWHKWFLQIRKRYLGTKQLIVYKLDTTPIRDVFVM